MTALERRCRVLLLAYPAGYRRERGEEMVATVLDGSPPGRRWPSLREGRGLVIGGLRARSGLHQPQAIAASLRLAALLGLVLVILGLAAGAPGQSWGHWPIARPGELVACLTLAVAAAAFFAPGRPAAALAVVTAGLWLWPAGGPGLQAYLAALALILLAVLVRGQPPMPRLWLWPAGALLAPLLPPELAYSGQLYRPGVPLILFWVIAGAIVAWIGVDPRPAIALLIYVGFLFIEAAGPVNFGSTQPHFPWRLAVFSAAAAPVAVAAIWRLHRQALT